MCPLCNCVFDSEFCLSSHYKKSIIVRIRNFEGKVNPSPCDLYFFFEKNANLWSGYFIMSIRKGGKKS